MGGGHKGIYIYLARNIPKVIINSMYLGIKNKKLIKIKEYCSIAECLTMI
jgi:hypothetical protein